MKEVVITADSTCDLPPDIIKKNNIIITPLSVLLGDYSYQDGVDVFPSDIYNYVEETGILPKTSAVTPSQYYDLFEQLTNEGKAVVHIGLSSAISSSYQNACIAASDFEDVYIVDSKSLCTGMGLLVLKACDFRAKGFEAKKIASRVNALVPKVSTTFVLSNLEYLHKGGRCSGVAKFSANVLGIKPSIAVDPKTGTLDVAKKYRGKMDTVYKQYINDCLKDVNKIDTSRIVIANSGGISPDIISFAKGVIEGKANFDEIILANAKCTISSHCGPKTLAIFYIRK
ncbi:MAG: DegV family protein [Eubacterium sp.]|nr:DegV family protein [Eubacterium sp.]MDE6156048.1 DegV family protein [Eubacterium sp.]